MKNSKWKMGLRGKELEDVVAHGVEEACLLIEEEEVASLDMVQAVE